MKFESLSLCEPLLRSLQAAGHDQATPIQQKAIPQVLKGRDLLGCAQTGTGKTAAFALPMFQHLMTAAVAPTGAARRRQRSGRRVIRTLILAPTRELAGQIGESLTTYGRFTALRHAVIFGGVRQGPQVRALQAGIDILVATPGRLLDLIGQGFVKLGSVEILILDEADLMLDMGFIHDLKKIVAQVPDRRQTLMFSATMPPEVRKVAAQWLRRPFEVQVGPVAGPPELVSQAVYFVEPNHKAATLTRYLRETQQTKTLVFSRTKRRADKIARCLQRDGIRALAIHGDKSQAKRISVIREFHSKRPPVLVATDLAARGLDFSDVSHVINYDLPDVPETYVHRIGRTARAGASGQAVSFCGRDERDRLRMVEKLIGQTVSVEKLSADSNDLKPRTATQGTGPKDASKTDSVDTSRHDAVSEEAKRPTGRRIRRKSAPQGFDGSKSATGSKQRRQSGRQKRRHRSTAAR
jgi:ATP-dependent RNA helicase RhlE